MLEFDHPNMPFKTKLKNAFVMGGIALGGLAAAYGIHILRNNSDQIKDQNSDVAVQTKPSDELVAAVKTVIDKHNASLPETQEEALAKFKKSSPDGEGRLVKAGDVFQIHQDPARGGSYGDYFCTPDCMRYDDIEEGRVPEIVASTLNKDETALGYTSEEFENTVLSQAFKMGGIFYATAGNDSKILATYDPSSDRVCQERQKIENGDVS